MLSSFLDNAFYVLAYQLPVKYEYPRSFKLFQSSSRLKVFPYFLSTPPATAAAAADRFLFFVEEQNREENDNSMGKSKENDLLMFFVSRSYFKLRVWNFMGLLQY